MNNVTVVSLQARDAETRNDALSEILIACVNSGASVSFMAPLSREKAHSFWRDVANSVREGERILLGTIEERTGHVVGTVQIILKQPENQPHRADVAKMLVHPDSRRRGVGALLMASAEDFARDARKTLLVLDTASGGDAARLYARMGWVRVGSIPDYALWPDGRLCDTTIFYKRL